MRQLTELSGKPISWDKSLDNETLTGAFIEQPLNVILDIFSSAFNISQLFSMFVDADGRLGSTVVDTRPVLLLSEGRKAGFEAGNERFLERRAVTENGVSSATAESALLLTITKR